MTRTNYDSPWKKILTQFLPDFVRFCLPDLAADIDWSRGYVLLDKELNAIGRQQESGQTYRGCAIQSVVKKRR